MAKPRNKTHEAWEFLWTIVIPSAACIAAYFYMPEFSVATRVAFLGGLLAVWGTFLVARPIWRLGLFMGPFNWITIQVLDDILGETEKSVAEKQEERHDKLFSQMLGPSFIGVGTFLNGISGLL